MASNILSWLPAPRGLLMHQARSAVHLMLLVTALVAHSSSITNATALLGTGDETSVEAGGAGNVRAAFSTDSLDLGSIARHLLHSGSHGNLPKCSNCKLFHPTGNSNWWFGHCRKQGRRHNCWKRKGSARNVIDAPSSRDELGNITPAAERQPAFRSGIPSPPPPSPEFPPFEPNLTATAPFVACLSDSDCSLPAADFAAINSSAPLSSGSELAGRCQRPELVNDPSGNFTDFPGICVCTYVAAAAPPGVRDLLSTCSTARDILLSFDSLIIDNSPLSSLISTGNCLQRGDFPPGPDGEPRTPFFVPGDGPYPILDIDLTATDANFTIVTDESQYAYGVVVADAYVDGDDPPGPCPVDSACVRNNRQCAGSMPELELARACCDEAYQCVRRSNDFAQCRLGGVPGITGWEGSILPCGTPHDAVV